MTGSWFTQMGLFGWVVGGLALTLFAAGVAACVVRVARRVAIALAFAAALPLLLALCGTVLGMIASFQVIESLKAPTPKDLAQSVHQSLLCTGLGVAGSLACAITGIAALLRSRDEDPEQPSE